MKPSSKIIEFVKQYESLHDGDLSKIGLQPKLCPAGYWTEGYGHVLRDARGKMLSYKDYKTVSEVLPFSTIRTEAEAVAQLTRNMEKFAYDVFKRLRINVSQNQFDALVSHSYNCGFSETLYRLVNSCAPESQIKNWFTTKYITAGGVPMKGLQYRRNDEYEIWSGVDYDREYNRSV